jgi:hypothetical protein
MEPSPQPPQAVTAPPSKIETDQAREVVYYVWYAGSAVLLIIDLMLVIGQAMAVNANEPPFVTKVGVEELLEFLWLANLCILPVVLLRTPVVARVLKLGHDRGGVTPRQLRIRIALEVALLAAILFALVLARGGWPLQDYTTPEQLLFFYTIPLWIMVLAVFFPFLPRSRSATPAEIEKVITSFLPESEHSRVPELARWLAEVVRSADDPEKLQKLVADLGELMGLLHQLAGKNVQGGTSCVKIGDGNTFGQMSIRDMIQGSQININLNVAGPTMGTVSGAAGK